MLGNMRFALPRVRNNCGALLLKELIKSAIDRRGVVLESEGFEAASFSCRAPLVGDGILGRTSATARREFR